MPRPELTPGATGEAEVVVEEQDLARAIARDPGDDFPAVFATARMIALMESAAARAMRVVLEPGELSVGVTVDVSHTAPTPPGAVVRASARFVRMDGKLYLFEVEARDEAGEIGRGTHRRAVVATARLVAGARKRRPGGPAAGDAFRGGPVDHVELTVPDRDAAAAWYARVLGLAVVPEVRSWADSPEGPLMISADRGRTKIALFQGARPGYRRVAFRTTGERFLDLLARLPALGLVHEGGAPVVAADAIDHEQSFSIYFSDPHGHRLEVTTYDHEEVRAALGRRA